MKQIKKYISALRLEHSRGLLIFVAAYQIFVFYVGRMLSTNKPHYDFSTALDAKIPLIPWTVVIYFVCYVFWVVNYILCCRFDEKQAKRFAYADLIGKTVCFIFYIVAPTTMQRPEIVGSNVFDGLMRFLYAIDAPDNLCPSIHCFVSWMAYIGMRGDNRYSRKYRVFSLVFAILVCISTLTTKQHVIVDVVAGVVLAEICFGLTKKLVK